MGLLAAEMTARSRRDPGAQYAALAAEFGEPFYDHLRRIQEEAHAIVPKAFTAAQG